MNSLEYIEDSMLGIYGKRLREDLLKERIKSQNNLDMSSNIKNWMFRFLYGFNLGKEFKVYLINKAAKTKDKKYAKFLNDIIVKDSIIWRE